MSKDIDVFPSSLSIPTVGELTSGLRNLLQAHSGLTRLREVAERLPLRTFRGEAAQMLYDLPGAPRPDADVPAPPRFLPEYDNLLLSYEDRTRLIPGNRPVPLPPGTGAATGTFLAGGWWQGTWQIQGRTLHIQPFTRLQGTDRHELLAEAAQLRALVAPANYDIVLDKPQAAS